MDTKIRSIHVGSSVDEDLDRLGMTSTSGHL